MTTIIFYLVLGLVAGALARAIMPGKQDMSIVMTIIIGIVGALVGGVIGNLIVGNGFTFELRGNWWVSLITAIVGSLIVLWAYMKFVRGRAAA